MADPCYYSIIRKEVAVITDCNFMKKKLYIVIILLLITISILAIRLIKDNNNTPVTLTLWHNYGGQMKKTMDDMIDEFNATVGREKGVIISVTSISGSTTLHDKLEIAANKDPGAPQLPDITTAYPKTALSLAKKDVLVNLDELFNKDELSAYIPRFIDEGRLEGEKLYVFPTAKSTEVLFVNMTIFNRFSDATGISLSELNTFEGIMNASKVYYEWTDSLTPDTANDGKTFFVSDSLFNYLYIGCKQLGVDLFDEGSFNFTDNQVRRVWESYYKSAVLGHNAIFDGYSSDLAKTGDIVCSTGSTAGVLFYSPTVTYPDNTKETAELNILPYPTFEGGRKMAVQRGAGMCITKSTKERERLAGVFLKWFTSPENNLRFVSSTGYLPVTDEAFGDIMLEEIDLITDENIKKLLSVSRNMQMQYEFCVAPIFDNIDEIQEEYENSFRSLASQTKENYISHPEALSDINLLSDVMNNDYNKLSEVFHDK